MRNFVCIIWVQIQSFLRRTIWLILLSVGIIATLGCFYYCYLLQAGAIEIMKQTVFGHAFITLTFLMMGIELRRELRSIHLENIANSYLKYPSLLSYAHVLALAILAASVTCIIIIGCLIPMLINDVPAIWIKQTALLIILQFFLPSTAMGYLGILISELYPKKNVYLPAVVIWFLTSSLLIYYTGNVSPSNNRLRLLINFTSMGFNNYQMYQNLVTGARIEFPRWIVRSAIGLIMASLYLSLYNHHNTSNKKNKNISKLRIGCITLCGSIFLSFLCLRYSEFFVRFADDYYTQILTFTKSYEYLSEDSVKIQEYPTEKNITLIETNIDLSCTTQGLNAEVTIVALVEEEIDRQSFTLFSDLIIDNVLVDGELSEYERKHDVLMVYFPEKKSVGEKISFTFLYHGYSLPSYPVNETTVQLNRAFPWIPWPGIRSISEEEVNNYTYSEAFHVEEWQQNDTVNYTLTYSGPGNVYTNLQKLDNNFYSGTSGNGVSLYSGMIYTRYKGVDAYVPAALYEYRTICIDAVLDFYEVLLEYSSRFDSLIKPAPPKTIAIIQMEYPSWGRIYATGNELFSRESTWEIRLSNEFSSVMSCRKRATSSSSYRSSLQNHVKIAVPYLINPCVGYPTDADRLSTDCFADLLSCYILSQDWDDMARQQHVQNMVAVYFQNEESMYQTIDVIFKKMQAGENFDHSLQKIYQCLMRSEIISPQDMVLSLFENTGD